MTQFFSLVSQEVAKNPVARAIAKARLDSSMRDFAITLYSLEDGSEQASNMIAAAKVLAVAIRVIETTQPNDTLPIIRGALSAIQVRSEHGFRWRSRDAVAIDYGMECARKVITAAPADKVQSAWVFVSHLERQNEEVT